MTPDWQFDYAVRLGCVVLATGFFAFVAGTMANLALTPVVLRWARRAAIRRQRPEVIAAWLLRVRLLPLGAIAVTVCGVSLPSYLWLEPHTGRESLGIGFLLAALAGAGLCSCLGGRAWRAARQAARFAAECRTAGLAVSNPAAPESRLWVIPEAPPLLALAGIVRPSLVISRAVLDRLAPEELAVSLRHEAAHLYAGDNIKRWLMRTLPGYGRANCVLEATWARMAEWAADDRAVSSAQGPDPARSLALAAALVAVAGLGSQSCPAFCSPLAGSMAGELHVRVRRLLRFDTPQASRRHATKTVIAGFFVAAALIALAPTGLALAHTVLEHLLR
ncbi:MAG TPA: hypothetical protein VN709_08360 [Terriglobales bacterium]|nr:hypothetical protein [Terriglobales bacterium]